MSVEPIKLGWKALAVWLNKLAAAVDAQEPIAGHGITCEPTGHGIIISLIPKTDPDVDPVTHAHAGTKVPATTGGGGGSSGIPAPPDGSTPGWQLINIMGPDCVQKTMYVYGTTPA